MEEYIKRDDAIYEIACRIARCKDDYDRAEAKAVDWLGDIQNADVVEVKRGTWSIKYTKLAWTAGLVKAEYTCSVCNRNSSYGDTAFCPHCGADMRGEGR